MNPADISRLANWLAYWADEKRLAAEDGAGGALPGDFAVPNLDFNSPQLTEWEIRILDPWLVKEVRRPLFFAILKQWSPGLWLIAPFGPIPQAASTGELQLKRHHSALTVLSLWNAHTVPEEILRRSWFVDTLKWNERADAWAVLRHVMCGARLADHMLERVGPDVRHPDDPRHAYFAAEAAGLEGLLEPAGGKSVSAERTVAVESLAEVIPFSVPAEALLAVAAGSSGTSVRRYQCPEIGRRITVTPDASQGRVIVRVTAPDDHRLVSDLDGGAVLLAGVARAKFSQGVAELAWRDYRGEMGIVDVAGHARSLVAEPEGA